MAGGIVYGLRFLRKNNLVDTRVPQFIGETLFGHIGYNYKLFYQAHSQKYGKSKTRLLLAVHFASAFMVFALPVILS
jgi:hypothetical protein